MGAFFGLESADELPEDEGTVLPLKLQEDELLDILDGDAVQDQELVEPVVVGQVGAEPFAVVLGKVGVEEVGDSSEDRFVGHGLEDGKRHFAGNVDQVVHFL